MLMRKPSNVSSAVVAAAASDDPHYGLRPRKKHLRGDDGEKIAKRARRAESPADDDEDDDLDDEDYEARAAEPERGSEISDDEVGGALWGNSVESSLAVDSGKSEELGLQWKVKEAVIEFHRVYEEVKLERESKPVMERGLLTGLYFDAATRMKKDNKWVNPGKWVGPVPGVDLGHEFCCRAELVITGVHGHFVSGIDFVSRKGKIFAVSIVASGRYSNDMSYDDEIIYSGEGGNPMVGKGHDDQKLDRGNLALKNSMDSRSPVRVVRGYKRRRKKCFFKDAGHEGLSNSKYVYEGIYCADSYWTERGRYGKMIYKFRLIRSKSLEASKDGRVVDDVPQGRETAPIGGPPPPGRAVDAIDRDQSVSDTRSSQGQGCGCANGCVLRNCCSCILKNRKAMPFDGDGRLLKRKPLIYECGPSCACPSSCMNRVTQRGIQFELELFKARGKGRWGIRTRSPIPSGSFVGEYVGEGIPTKLLLLMQEGDADGGCFAIPAEECGNNVGSLINRSCRPNVCAQAVLYGQEDERMPRVMLFASKDIPPLTELTCDYGNGGHGGAAIGTRRRKKECHCGSLNCTWVAEQQWRAVAELIVARQTA